MRKLLLCLLFTFFYTQAHSQSGTACSVTFGNNLSFTNNGVAGFYQLLGAVAAAPNTILNTVWFEWSNSSGSGSATITAGIYASLAGSPTTLIAQTNNLVVSSASWAKLTLATPVTLSNGVTYFVAGYDSDQSYQFTNGLSGQLCGYTGDSYNNTLPSAIIGYTVLGSSDAWSMFADFCSPPPTPTPTPGASTYNLFALTHAGVQQVSSTFSGTKLAYLACGDSITAGSAADPISNSWVNLTSAYISGLVPNVGLINKGFSGITSSAYDFGMTGVLNTVAGYGYGPIGYASLFFGMNNFDTPYTSCNACTENANPTQLSAAATFYYNELVDMTNKILAYNTSIGAPSVVPNIIICSCPDPNNEGLGPVDPFVPASAVTLFRSEAVSVVSYFQGLGDMNVQFVDIYNIMYQEPTWFASSVHPNNTGHSAIALGANGYEGTEAKLTGM